MAHKYQWLTATSAKQTTAVEELGAGLAAVRYSRRKMAGAEEERLD
jgi:hypothetical protein